MASRNIAHCHPLLQEAWSYASKKWEELYPNEPQPFITATYRDDEEQEILYMRDKNHMDDDGDGDVDEKDEWRSNAKPGQSKHNKYPAEAMDIAFRSKKGKLDWSEKLFFRFAGLMKEDSEQIIWGGDWTNRRDTPHFEI